MAASVIIFRIKRVRLDFDTLDSLVQLDSLDSSVQFDKTVLKGNESRQFSADRKVIFDRGLQNSNDCAFMTRQIRTPAGNLALLQWLVVDVAGQCSLITIAGRTRQTSSDKSATASNAGRYSQCKKL